jgi:hypothetical protein
MILDGLEGNSSAGCDATGWFLCCGLLKYQMARCQDQAIIHATNSQEIQTIASQSPQLILIHPMDDFGWSGREFKCRM